jgi:hypothetical protein
MGALKNLRRREAGEGSRKEEVLIRQLVAGEWGDANDMPSCLPTELVTVALAASRYDLLPDYYADPLEVYFQVLDDRQREIVNGHRRWGDRASFNSDLRGSLTVTGI